jgi:predicted Abi (CAAX) family protease
MKIFNWFRHWLQDWGFWWKKRSPRWQFMPAVEPLLPLDERLIEEIQQPTQQAVARRCYQPVGTWTGRLILPTPPQRRLDGAVLFEVQNAEPAYSELVGQVVWLQWSVEPLVQQFVETVTRDVELTQPALISLKAGNIHPERLNHWKRVGPLESLAGARPQDNVIVSLPEPVEYRASSPTDQPTLIIQDSPVQITGRQVALVKIIRPETRGSERFLIRHYNLQSQEFDGPWEIIQIPQVSPDFKGILKSSINFIEQSALNEAGWYVYGERGVEGIFITQAIEPRAIVQLQPDEVRIGLPAAKAYLHHQNWKHTTAKKGTARTVLLTPTASLAEQALVYWKEGDQALVIHTFGGIGGNQAEPTLFGVVTGHFAYGVARVVRDRFTKELRFEIEYQQVYAHNVDGIVAGATKWCCYMGNLQRGWLGSRPVCDIVVKLDAITQDYQFDEIRLSPLKEFCRHLAIMTARYRIGDGTGAAVVTPATSCVQDSHQALYITIQQVEATIASHPQIQDWLNRHPDHPQTQRFQQLVQLSRALEERLVPVGICRSDWQKNALNLKGTPSHDPNWKIFLKALTTWRTILPRRAHDEISEVLLRHGAQLWVIRTNQVGGFNPNIEPLAPTAIFGHRCR